METRVEFTEMFASYGRCLLAHLLAKMGILAVSIGAESVNAQAYSPYSASRAYTSRAYAPPKPRLGSPLRSAHWRVFQLGESCSHRRW
jgi:hypothetical protein